MQTISIVFEPKEGVYTFPAHKLTVHCLEAAMIPGLGDLYSFDGADYYTVVQRRWLMHNGENLLRVILE